jgi:hypothetical protein
MKDGAFPMLQGIEAWRDIVPVAALMLVLVLMVGTG